MVSDVVYEEMMVGEVVYDDGVFDDDEIGGVVDDVVVEGEVNVMYDVIDMDDDVCEVLLFFVVVLDDDVCLDSARECSFVSASASGIEVECL